MKTKRYLCVLVFYLTPLVASGTPNDHIYVTQKLLFVSDHSYGVLSMEYESTLAYNSKIQRVSIGTYSIESNELEHQAAITDIMSTYLHEQKTITHDFRAVQPTSTSGIMETPDKSIVGYPVKGTNGFGVDDKGVYLLKNNTKVHVVKMSSIQKRLKYPETDFTVVGMHKEERGTKKRYFVVLRSKYYGEGMDVSEYEIVLSIPEQGQ